MEITYASHHVWLKSITGDPFDCFSKKLRSRLRSTIKNIPETSIRHEISPLSDETIDWFTPLYNETISSKNNPKLFDIRGTTIGKESKFHYYSLVLFEADEPIGATIFSERNEVVSIAYRIYPNKWTSHDLRTSPSYYTEYLIGEHGSQNGFTKLSHGRDRNPYGYNSHIGLAMFKLSVGCSVYLPKGEYETNTLNTDDINEDILIFKKPEEERQVTEGYLCVKEENLEKYTQALKYPEQIKIETILR